MKKVIHTLTIDTETDRIGYKNVAPNLVCLTYHLSLGPGAGILVPWEKSPIDEVLISLMETHYSLNCKMRLVGHNICFDLAVLIKKYPYLLPYVFKWFDRDLIHDTLINEKLLNLTRHGQIDLITVNGAATKAKYSLADLENKYLGIDRHDQKTDPDAPRTNYDTMMGVPLTQWPDNYKTYAIEDAINTGGVYEAQLDAQAACIDQTGYDPFIAATAKVRDHFGLYLIQIVGSCVDGKKLLEVQKYYEKQYRADQLRKPLLDSGLLIDAIPPQPYVNGAQDHKEICTRNKNHPEYKAAKFDCGCPVKMTAEKKETENTYNRFDYVFNLARSLPYFRLKPSDACAAWLKGKTNNTDTPLYDILVGEDGYFKNELLANLNKELPDGSFMPSRRLIPGDKDSVLKFSMNKEWQANFCSYGSLDYIYDGEKASLLQVWHNRNVLSKMITEYIPKMFYTNELGEQVPAEIIHGSYDPLKKTGRSGCRTSDLYPSRNDQNVDPRIREVTIPRPGNVIVSTDYERMELGTAAQKCYDLFGYSVLRDKINAGVDVHAFLGARIAYAMDPLFHKAVQSQVVNGQISEAAFNVFEQLKGIELPCESPDFRTVFIESHPNHTGEITWKDFYKHYRNFAKPTGLGYPGGLGPATFISFAKGTYGVTVDLETATQLRDIWKQTFPEMDQYLKWVSKECIDKNHHPIVEYDEAGVPKKIRYYTYDTPRGMHRAKCTFCQAANGQALQAFSAEGALTALYRVQKAFWLAEHGDLLYGCIVINFVHDEIIWESPNDDRLGARARAVEKIMVDAMQEITPDVRAGAESAAMYRWNKYAEPLWDGDNLMVWEPEPEI
ncbi:MAG: hypothetical protein GY845_25875 [Planctomycetes bacterium]|nr:hypothetical protein [Planctomycetota bacterium]